MGIGCLGDGQDTGTECHEFVEGLVTKQGEQQPLEVDMASSMFVEQNKVPKTRSWAQQD
jgi:hypothetical protein